ncbi:MAG: DNA-directed DNA polymerase II small subunit [Candidatus Methanomethylophilaceae archaeon]|jgi:DNA polymerase II small subunit
MREEVLSAAARKNVFLSPEALEMVLSNSHPIDFINTVLTKLSENSMFVTKKDVMDAIAGDTVIYAPQKTIKVQNSHKLDISVVPGTDVTGDSTCEGKIEDFANYFRNRYYTLRKIIEKRKDFGSAMPIEKAMRMDRETKIIGIIYEKKDTKNGHVILKVEDETTMCSVFISKDSPLIGETFINDEVIGIAGKPTSNKELYIANEIYHPDVPSSNKWVPSDSSASVAFLSDVHIGSYTFLENNWKKMIAWLKANSAEKEIDYIVFPGDVVDGIGVFPGQEEELTVDNIYDQYSMLSEYLKDIPDHIQMVIHPGNHDAVRLAEPQPALPEIFRKSFDSNIMMVGNPITLNIEGRTVLSYHGKGIDDWIAGVRELTYEDPLKVMKNMMIRRHLAPMYGQRNALAPEKKDYLVIDRIPDIFVSGHVHGAGTMEYKGIRMINASSWQSQTEYQKMHNFNPDPGIMPIVGLGTGKTTMMNFMK